MAGWDLQHTRWFHAVNTRTLLAEAVAALDAAAAAAAVALPPSSPADDGVIPVIGIEADIRFSPPGGVVGGVASLARQPIMRHDAVEAPSATNTTDDPHFTLWDFFDGIAASEWFLSRERGHEDGRGGGRPPCRLVLKLDFKDPRAARRFQAHVATSFANSGTDNINGGEGSSFARLCRVLAPPHDVMPSETEPRDSTLELVVWWNADVCASDSRLRSSSSSGTGRKDHTTSGDGKDDDGKEKDGDALNLVFIDLPHASLVALVSETIRAFPPTVAAAALGISIGWVLAPPPPPPPPPPSSSFVPSTANAQRLYYTAADGQRMQEFVTDLCSSQRGKWAGNGDGTTTTTTAAAAALPVRLVTFPVLYEAILTPHGMLGATASGGGGGETTTTTTITTADTTVIHNEKGIAALYALLAHTAVVGRLTTADSNSNSSAMGPTDAEHSDRCFVTFWKTRREPAGSAAAAEDLSRAMAYFPSCTVDGTV